MALLSINLAVLLWERKEKKKKSPVLVVKSEQLILQIFPTPAGNGSLGSVFLLVVPPRKGAQSGLQ